MAKQISEQQIDLIVERLIDRVEKANTSFLMGIGKSIKQIRDLTPLQAHQLIQVLKYGGNYDEITKQIAKYTDLNIKDVDAIFEEYAKKDQQFYKQFYEYRNKPFVPFEENLIVKKQTQSLANVVKSTMYDFTRENVLGYTIKDLDGNVQFLGLKETYNRVLDEALLNVSQGKETFNSSMSHIMKEIGGSGLKTIEYASGKSMRLDSAVRMQLKDGLRNLHNENQQIYGKEFDSDGVEISVHLNPAPDHSLVQGRQFSTNKYDESGKLIKKGEFEKFQNDEDAKSYDGIEFPAVSEETGHDRRSISQYNCYHTIFPIILGVSKPEYSNEQLQEIIDENEKGFELDGKHFTNYEGTQLQRQLERKIREQKDTQILAKASGNDELVGEAQRNITVLTHKYHELSKVSGLPTKAERLRVSGYRRTKVK